MIDRPADPTSAPAAHGPPAPPPAPPAEPEGADPLARGALMGAAGVAYLLRGFWSLVAQFFLVAAGVYLGIQADQWKEDRDRRRAARATLEDFRREIRMNAAAIRERLPYHEQLRDSLESVLRRPVRTLTELQTRIRFRGSRSVDFAHTAYDLALSTEALAHLPRDLAFAVADVYTRQAAFQRMQDAYMQAIYQPTTFSDANTMPLAVSLGVYMGDVTYQEPMLLGLYAKVLPRLDSAIARLPQ